MSFRRDEAGASGPKHKREAAANRDALFGPPSSSTGKTPAGSRKPASSSTGSSRNRPATTSSAQSSTSSASAPSSTTRSSAPPPPAAAPTSQGYSYQQSSKPSILSTSVLSGAAKVSKMQEAEDYRKQATKAMQSGLFTKPDPIAAATYYKRAADAYQQCGENRLERLHRIASGDCSRGTGTFATAAAEYTRAAQLAQASDEAPERKQQEGNKLYTDAALAWREIGETSKAAKCLVQAALALLWERDVAMLPKNVLEAMEQAVEAHVPDVLNRYGRYRQTGTSAFLSPGESIETPSAQALAMAKDQMVTQTYAQEGLQELIPVLVQFGEYASALYAAGAISAILERDGVSTLSLARSYVVETILTLALGDAVAAEQAFLNTHVQSTAYLSSRECQLAEELFRAILQRDAEALEEARSPSGRNRAALANLPNDALRQLVAQLRVSGVAKRITNVATSGTSTTTNSKALKAPAQAKPFETPSQPRAPLPSAPVEPTQLRSPPVVQTAAATNQIPAPGGEDELDGDALQAEMDNLMDELDMGDEDEVDQGDGVDDDDDIDLR